MASCNGHLEIVRTLLEKGANMEAKGNVRTLMIVEMMLMMVMNDGDGDDNDELCSAALFEYCLMQI